MANEDGLDRFLRALATPKGRGLLRIQHMLVRGPGATARHTRAVVRGISADLGANDPATEQPDLRTIFATLLTLRIAENMLLRHKTMDGSDRPARAIPNPALEESLCDFDRAIDGVRDCLMESISADQSPELWIDFASLVTRQNLQPMSSQQQTPLRSAYLARPSRPGPLPPPPPPPVTSPPPCETPAMNAMDELFQEALEALQSE